MTKNLTSEKHTGANVVVLANLLSLPRQSAADRTEADIDRMLDECGDAIDAACPWLSTAARR